MSRRPPASPASLAAAALALACAACGTDAPPPPRNVLLIVVDTLRADHLSCYGHGEPISPHIDALAADGWRYERALSQAPWTTPSLGALFTSRYPTMLGIEDVRAVVPDTLTLLPETLRTAGLATGAVVSHSFCSSDWGFNQGYDTFDETNVLGHAGISSKGVSDRGIEFLDAHADEPFFLWLHYFDPHNQYIPHLGHGAAPDPAYRGRVTPDTSFRKLKKLDLAPAELAEVKRYYDSEIAFTDHHIGRVLAHLDTLSLRDSTAVIFTADHGEEFFEHGRLGHAHSVYDELVRVPLILRLPGHAPRTIEHPVGTIDLYPTVLDLLDLPLPDGLFGHSLLDDGIQRPVFTETSRQARLRALIRGPRKLVKDLDTDTYALYDLREDPGEQTPLPPDQALVAELEAWLELTAQESIDTQVLDLAPDQLQELGELGYAESEH